MSGSPFWNPKQEEAAFATPTGAGKGPRGGVTLSNKGVGIIEIDVEKEIGGIGKCGGRIGKAAQKKMCIKEDCKVAAHQNSKIDLEALGIAGINLFIQVGEGVVLVEPTLPSYLMGENLEAHRFNKMDVEKWEACFAFYRNGDEGVSAEDWKETVKDFEDHLAEEEATAVGKTPYKRRPKMEIKSSPLADDFEKLNLGIQEQLPRSGNFEETIRQEWKVLAQVVDNMHKQLGSLKSSLKEMGEYTKSELGNIELALFFHKSLFGQRDPEIFGKATVFELLEELFSELEALSSKYQASSGTTGATTAAAATAPPTASDLRNVLGISTDTADEVITFSRLRTLLGFTAEFVNSWSGSGVGSTLKNTITSLQDQITQLEAQVKTMDSTLRANKSARFTTASSMAPQQPATATFFKPSGFGATGTPVLNPIGTTFTATNMSVSGIQGTMGAISGDPLAQTVFDLKAAMEAQAAELVALKAELNEANKQIKQLQDEAQTSAVVVSTTTFPTPSWAGGWLDVNVPDPVGYVFFVDPHAMLQMIYDSIGRTTASDLKMRADAVKVGIQSPLEASVITSFANDLPLIFGSVQTPGALLTQDSRILPSVSTYERWGPVGAYDGASRILREKVREMATTLKYRAQQHLSPEGQRIAEEMISKTASFLDNLGSWMTKEFMTLRHRGANKDVAWLLISQLVRALFSELHEARASGRVMDYGDRSRPIMFWGCLQGYRRMEIFAKHEFNRDPILSAALFLHLRDNSLSQKDKEDLEERIDKIAKTATGAKTAADKADTKAQKALDVKGGRTGKKPGAAKTGEDDGADG